MEDPVIPRGWTREKYDAVTAALDDGWSWDQIMRTHHTSWQALNRHFPGTQMDFAEAGRLGGQVRRINERMGKWQ